MRKLPLSFWMSLTLLGLVLALAWIGPWVGPDPSAINPDLPTALPSGTHWFGTDELGRDLFSRLALGARISFLIGLATALVAVLLGTAYGTVSALLEGPVDGLMMRLIDVLYSLPGLMVVILFTLFFNQLIGHPGNVLSLVLALSLFSWPDTARIIRGQVLGLKREAFVEAYHNLGGSTLRLVLTHMLPNLAGLIILMATITVPRAILTESTLSFVGLGVAPPLSSWGTMIHDGWQMIRIAPHLVLLPGLMLFITMVALNMQGESLKRFFQTDAQ